MSELQGHSSSTRRLAAVVLLAAVMQTLAAIALGLGELVDVRKAAAEGPGAYVGSTLFAAAAVATAWSLRRRPAIALPLLFLWPLPIYLLFGHRLTALGLAFHGEFILYHFVGFVGAAATLGFPLRWALFEDDLRPLGALRFVPLVGGSVAAIGLGLAHLAGVPWIRVPGVEILATVGAAALLLTWPTTLVIAWSRSGPPGPRLALGLLWIPFAVRLLGAQGNGLTGAPIAPDWTFALGLAFVATSAVVAYLVRPRLEWWVQGLIAGVCVVAVTFFWLLYNYMFGIFEDGLDGLIRSFVGFTLPYPEYVADWKVLGFMLGAFFVLNTIYATLVSTADRPRGVALALFAVGGIGLSSPHLLLLTGTGVMLYLDTLLWPQRSIPRERPEATEGPLDGEELLDAVAERIVAEPPVTVDGVTVLRHHLEGVALDVRVRASRMEATIGHPGRSRPTFELVPAKGDGGQRPAHLVSRSHKVAGDPRALEDLGDRPLDAMVALPQLRARYWEGGWELELRRGLADLTADRLEALLRACARSTR